MKWTCQLKEKRRNGSSRKECFDHACIMLSLAIFLINKYWLFLVLARFYKKKKKKRKDYF